MSAPRHMCSTGAAWLVSNEQYAGMFSVDSRSHYGQYGRSQYGQYGHRMVSMVTVWSQYGHSMVAVWSLCQGRTHIGQPQVRGGRGGGIHWYNTSKQ